MLSLGTLGQLLGDPPRGEVLFTATPAGGEIWTVPEGVTSICAVCIGGGGASYRVAPNYASGGGGGLIYVNNHPVTPGQQLTIAVTNTESLIVFNHSPNRYISARAGGAASAAAAGAAGTTNFANFAVYPYATYGGAGVRTTTSQAVGGGSAGRYNGDGATGGGSGSSAHGYSSAASYGRGGGVTAAGSQINVGPQVGVVRIMWGAGRSFPSNAA